MTAHLKSEQRLGIVQWNLFQYCRSLVYYPPRLFRRVDKHNLWPTNRHLKPRFFEKIGREPLFMHFNKTWQYLIWLNFRMIHKLLAQPLHDSDYIIYTKDITDYRQSTIIDRSKPNEKPSVKKKVVPCSWMSLQSTEIIM